MKQPYLSKARAWNARPTEAESTAAVAAQTPIAASSRRRTFGETQAAKPVVDQQATARLVAALDVVLAASDAVSLAVKHFNALPPDTAPPASWVDRAVDLHVALLEAWWALDDEAAVDAAAGGWTVGPPHAIGTAVERRKIRTVWETELMKPAGKTLWWDRLAYRVDIAMDSDEAEAAGRALVEEGARRRFAAWRNTREETGS